MRLVATPPLRMSDGHRLICLASGLLLVIARIYPFDRFPLATCPLKHFTHIPCPGCGMTRAFVRWTHFDWSGSIHVSPLGFVLAALATAAALYGVLRHTVLRQGWSLQLTSRETAVLRIVGVTVLLTNWVYLVVTGAAA
jgi:hypothetical protein